MEGDGSESASSSGVSKSKFSNCEIFLKTVISELVSEFIPDDELI